MKSQTAKSVSLRSVVIGLILTIVNAYWVTVTEVRWYCLDGTCLPLFITPIFILFIVTVLNIAVKRAFKVPGLTQGELLTIYIILVMSCSLAGHDMLQNMFGSILHPYRFASPANKWDELFFKYIPSWLSINNEEVLRNFYEGHAYLYTWENLRFWLRPLLAWGLFVMLLVLMMLFMNVLVRKQWIENEKLSFPLVQLPLRMTIEGGGGEFFKSRLMWIGFGVSAFIDILNGLHYLYPFLPWIPVSCSYPPYNLHQYFRSRPWTSIGWTPLDFYPFMIGIAFFLPADLSLSCWFFYVFRKFEQIFGDMIGVYADPSRPSYFPYFREQSSGAWIGLCLVVLWMNRHYLKEVVIKALKGEAEAEEPISYRSAFIGIIICFIGLIIFCLKAGMAVWVSVLFFSLYFILSLAMTRVRAELGAPHEIYFVNPHQIMQYCLGTEIFSKRDMTVVSYFYWFNRCYRCHPMPTHIEAFKMTKEARMNARRVFFLIIFATLFSLFVVYWANLDVNYKDGAQAKDVGFKSWVGWESFNRLQDWLQNPRKTEWPSVGYMGIGFFFMFFLMMLRTRFLWFPFHPAGYALAISFAMDYFWFSFFLAWLAKVLILRYGGMKLHGRVMPLFLGLILGDYVFGALWSAIGSVLGISTYKIFI